MAISNLSSRTSSQESVEDYRLGIDQKEPLSKSIDDLSVFLEETHLEERLSSILQSGRISAVDSAVILKAKDLFRKISTSSRGLPSPDIDYLKAILHIDTPTPTKNTSSFEDTFHLIPPLKQEEVDSKIQELASKRASCLTRNAEVMLQIAEPLTFATPISLRSDSSDSPIPEHLRRFAKNAMGRPSQSPVQIHKQSPIGKGGNGIVYEGTVNHEECAIKIPKAGLTTREEAIPHFNHPYILEATVATEEYIAFPLADRGDLLTFIADPSTTADELHYVLYCAAQGYDHMHKQGFVHRDLKPENILVKTNQSSPYHLIGLVSDNALVLSISNYEKNEKMGGTLLYKPKETTKAGPDEATAADAYAFGMSLFSLLKKEEIKTPFVTKENPTGKFDNQIALVYVRLNYPELTNDRIQPLLSKDKCDRFDKYGILSFIMQECLQDDPKKRPKMSEIAELLLIAINY